MYETKPDGPHLRKSVEESPRTNNPPLVCTVVLNYNGAQMTIDCVNSVLKSDYLNYRVIVVDNASADDSVVRLKTTLTDPRVDLLLNDKNGGYAGGNNRGIVKALSKGAEYVLVLNNDTLIDPGCLRSLVEAMEAEPRIGIGGCRIIDVGYESSPNRGQSVSLFTGKTAHWRDGGPVQAPADVDFICGASIMLRAKILYEIGAFDSNFFMYCEDADICFRARKAGYRVCFIPGPGIRHFTGSTAKGHSVRPLVSFYSTRNRIWFIRRHGKLQHKIVFCLFNLCYQFPRATLAHVLRGQFCLLRPSLSALWHGWLGCAYPVQSYSRINQELQNVEN